MAESRVPRRRDVFVFPTESFGDIRILSENFRPEHHMAIKALERLTPEQRLAVKLRYGADVMEWWRDTGGQFATQSSFDPE